MENQAEYTIANQSSEVNEMSDFKFLSSVQGSLFWTEARLNYEIEVFKNKKDKYFVEMLQEELEKVQANLKEVDRRLTEEVTGPKTERTQEEKLLLAKKELAEARAKLAKQK